jgi:hypothetical protein
MNWKKKTIARTYVLLMRLMLIVVATRLVWTGSPPRIDTHPTNVIVNVSDPVTLECRASGEPPPKIVWYKDGVQLNINNNSSTSRFSLMGVGAASQRYALIHDSSLFIFSASLGKGNRSGDTGIYQCKAQNQHGEMLSTNASLSIVYLKEDFREVPKSRQVNAGARISMECKAPKGLPDPLIWWEKNGQQLPASNTFLQAPLSSTTSYYTFSNGTLLIANASVHDNGEYICVAKNDAGVRKSAPAHLNVFEKPSFQVQPETGKYAVGTRVELECRASGFPRPQIEWKRDQSAENIPLKAQIKDSKLIIPNMQVEDEGEYACVASNQLASIESKAYVIAYEKPSFIRSMTNITVGIESKSITIECNARGRPQPVIYWAKSTHVPMSNSGVSSALAGKSSTNVQEDFLILENGNLFIEQLSKKYEGTYLCQATNEYGSIEAKTYLQVRPIQSRPPPLILYGPQNQTIPINTHASLECIVGMGGSQTSIKTSKNRFDSYENIHLMGNDDEKVSIAWYKGSQLIGLNSQYEAGKYRLHENGQLEISSVQKYVILYNFSKLKILKYLYILYI